MMNLIETYLYPLGYLILYSLKKDKFLTRRKDFYSQMVSKGDLIYDVGANIGNRIEPFIQIGAKVVAVEPQPKCHNYLKLKFGSKITVVKKGLASEVGKKEFFISKSHVLSSFSSQWIDSLKNNKRFSQYKWDKTILVEITTLDNLIRTYGVPKFIKIDVEGFEFEVLKGLSQSIDYLSFEYAVPEQLENVKKCLARIREINPKPVFNYSVGESMEWKMNTWVSYDEMLELVQSKEFIDTSFGDIYVKKL